MTADRPAPQDSPLDRAVEEAACHLTDPELVAAARAELADLRAAVERLERELGEALALAQENADVGDRTAELMQGEVDRLQAEVERLREAFDWIEPMAAGFANEHDVGRNREILRRARKVRASGAGEGEGGGRE